MFSSGNSGGRFETRIVLGPRPADVVRLLYVYNKPGVFGTVGYHHQFR